MTNALMVRTFLSICRLACSLTNFSLVTRELGAASTVALRLHQDQQEGTVKVWQCKRNSLFDPNARSFLHRFSCPLVQFLSKRTAFGKTRFASRGLTQHHRAAAAQDCSLCMRKNSGNVETCDD